MLRGDEEPAGFSRGMRTVRVVRRCEGAALSCHSVQRPAASTQPCPAAPASRALPMTPSRVPRPGLAHYAPSTAAPARRVDAVAGVGIVAAGLPQLPGGTSSPFRPVPPALSTRSLRARPVARSRRRVFSRTGPACRKDLVVRTRVTDRVCDCPLSNQNARVGGATTQQPPAPQTQPSLRERLAELHADRPGIINNDRVPPRGWPSLPQMPYPRPFAAAVSASWRRRCTCSRPCTPDGYHVFHAALLCRLGNGGGSVRQGGETHRQRRRVGVLARAGRRCSPAPRPAVRTARSHGARRRAAVSR